MEKKIRITENSLRDGIQSLLATRVKTQDMIEVVKIYEEIGFSSVEVWGGATYDACLRYLGEDPFERLDIFKQIFKTTPLQMLLRGQNLVGYRHYADDVVRDFIRLSSEGGIDIFRVFDALNDSKNLKVCIEEILKNGKHAQGAICYTTSSVHKMSFFVSYAKELVNMGCQSIAIKDMAGLLRPYAGFELVKAIKEEVGVDLAIHVHSTTGFAFATLLKAVEAGVDIVDLSNSALSGGTSHPSTQAMVETLKNTQWDTKLDLKPMEKASKLLKEVRKKYSQFESSFNQVDTEILLTQIPGGMISNLANQLKEQDALHQMDEVAQEIIKVREDFGYIPLVTPTSQIVGTQAVLNVLQKERYKTLTTESKNLLSGFYGKTPAPIAKHLEAFVLQDIQREQEEMPKVRQECANFACNERDIISYALFKEVAKNFFDSRGKEKKESLKQNQENNKIGNFFEVHSGGEKYAIEILNIEDVQEGKKVVLKIDGDERSVEIGCKQEEKQEEKKENAIYAPMSGICTKIFVSLNQGVKKGEILGIIEAMKMENEILSPKDGMIEEICILQGEAVNTQKILFLLKEEGK